jgi:hypothetical protein
MGPPAQINSGVILLAARNGRANLSYQLFAEDCIQPREPAAGVICARRSGDTEAG